MSSRQTRMCCVGILAFEFGRLKALFDPDNRLNPGKVLPTGRGCLEIRQAPLAAGSAVY